MKKFTMVNSTDFTNRLKKIMEHHQLTASQFADQIGVPRSSISHILSGRNKPSLDFTLKVTGTFSDVDIYWLLNGKGTFPQEEKNGSTPTLSSPQTSGFPVESQNKGSKKISRIVVFYNDGTFDEYNKG